MASKTNSLRHRLEFEKLISSVSTNFINLPPEEIDSGIREALGTVGRFINADRSYVYLFSEDRKSARLVYDWTASEGASSSERQSQFPVADFPWSMQRLMQFQHIAVQVDDIPVESAKERAAYEAAGNRSVVMVPMVYNRETLGVLGVGSASNLKWSDEVVALLRITSEIFINALQRNRVERALRESEARYRLMAENSTDIISRTTTSGVILYASDASRRLLGYEPAELAGKSIYEFMHPDDREETRQLSFLINEATPTTYTYRLMKAFATR